MSSQWYDYSTMARKKKKRQDKEVARLRREMEALRAQLKNESGYQSVKVSRKEKAAQETQTERSVIDIRSDLKRTAFLTAICLGILLTLFVIQPKLNF